MQNCALKKFYFLTIILRDKLYIILAYIIQTTRINMEMHINSHSTYTNIIYNGMQFIWYK